MNDSRNTLLSVDVETAKRVIIALISKGGTAQQEQAHEIFEQCVSPIANKKTEPTDYKALLLRYMLHVLNHESFTYIDAEALHCGPALIDGDYDLLREIEKEAMRIGGFSDPEVQARGDL
mgnify:CR=1 FL=1|tara:strand:+ start:8955 stop:9314 length:360 start_codon:yes stop_codon:yes gene_type:complete